MSYSSQTISGYNSSPPPDDGSNGSNNKVYWSTIKTKLFDPVKNLLSNVDAQVVAELGSDYSLKSKTIYTNSGPTDTLTGDDADSIQIYTYSGGDVDITVSDVVAWAAGNEVTLISQLSAGYPLVPTMNISGDGITIHSYTGAKKDQGSQYDVIRLIFISPTVAMLWGTLDVGAGPV